MESCMDMPAADGTMQYFHCLGLTLQEGSQTRIALLEEKAAAAEQQRSEEAAVHASAQEDKGRLALLQGGVTDLRREVEDLKSRLSSAEASQAPAASTAPAPEWPVQLLDRPVSHMGATSDEAKPGSTKQQDASASAEPAYHRAEDASRDANKVGTGAASRDRSASSGVLSQGMAAMEERMSAAEKGLALCKRKLMLGQAESEGMAADVAELRAQLAAEQVSWPYGLFNVCMFTYVTCPRMAVLVAYAASCWLSGV